MYAAMTFINILFISIILILGLIILVPKKNSALSHALIEETAAAADRFR